MTSLSVQRNPTEQKLSGWKQDPIVERAIGPFRTGDLFNSFPHAWQLNPYETMMMKPFGLPMESHTTRPLTGTFNIDIIEKPKSFCICADFPGVKKEDVDICLEGDFLTIRAERKWDHDATASHIHHTERAYGIVKRSFRIPENANKEKFSANFENGVLMLDLPKKTTPGCNTAVRIPINEENKLFKTA